MRAICRPCLKAPRHGSPCVPQLKRSELFLQPSGVVTRPGGTRPKLPSAEIVDRNRIGSHCYGRGTLSHALFPQSPIRRYQSPFSGLHSPVSGFRHSLSPAIKLLRAPLARGSACNCYRVKKKPVIDRCNLRLSGKSV